MLRPVSYPIARFFTSIAMGLAVLGVLVAYAPDAVAEEDPNMAPTPQASPTVKNLAAPVRTPVVTPAPAPASAAAPAPEAAPTATPVPSASEGQLITAVVGFQDMKGNMLFLHDFKGKAVIVNLWASWCGPCVQEMPSLARLQQQYKDKGLVVIALSEDDSPEIASKFYSAHAITGLAPYFDKDHAVMTALAARGLPTSLLITRSGQAALQRIEGPIDWQAASFKPTIEWLLKTK